MFYATMVISLITVVSSILMGQGFSQNASSLQASGANTTTICPPKAPKYTMSDVQTGFIITVFLTGLVSYLTFHLMKMAVESPNNRGRFGILRDSEGYGSLTNFQFLVWTFVFLFSIVWVYAVRIQGGVLTPTIGIPSNAWALMGVNTASAVVSKAITAGQQDKSQNLKAQNTRAHSLWTMFNEDDDGQPTLSRVQMFIWTLVSVAIYVWVLLALLIGPFVLNSSAYAATCYSSLSIPDVDPTLVTLMGLSHAAFLGRKYYSNHSS